MSCRRLGCCVREQSLVVRTTLLDRESSCLGTPARPTSDASIAARLQRIAVVRLPHFELEHLHPRSPDRCSRSQPLATRLRIAGMYSGGISLGPHGRPEMNAVRPYEPACSHDARRLCDGGACLSSGATALTREPRLVVPPTRARRLELAPPVSLYPPTSAPGLVYASASFTGGRRHVKQWLRPQPRVSRFVLNLCPAIRGLAPGSVHRRRCRLYEKVSLSLCTTRAIPRGRSCVEGPWGNVELSTVTTRHHPLRSDPRPVLDDDPAPGPARWVGRSGSRGH